MDSTIEKYHFPVPEDPDEGEDPWDLVSDPWVFDFYHPFLELRRNQA